MVTVFQDDVTHASFKIVILFYRCSMFMFNCPVYQGIYAQAWRFREEFPKRPRGPLVGFKSDQSPSSLLFSLVGAHL